MTDYEAFLAELRARRTALDRERVDLDTAIGALERLLSSASGNTSPLQVQAETRSVSPRAFVGLTMPNAITKCLKLAQQPLTKRQIQDTLKAGGVKAGSSFSAHVYNTLHRLSKDDGLYRRESDGRWSLREWQDVQTDSGTVPLGGGTY